MPVPFSPLSCSCIVCIGQEQKTVHLKTPWNYLTVVFFLLCWRICYWNSKLGWDRSNASAILNRQWLLVQWFSTGFISGHRLYIGGPTNYKNSLKWTKGVFKKKKNMWIYICVCLCARLIPSHRWQQQRHFQNEWIPTATLTTNFKIYYIGY